MPLDKKNPGLRNWNAKTSPPLRDRIHERHPDSLQQDWNLFMSERNNPSWSDPIIRAQNSAQWWQLVGRAARLHGQRHGFYVKWKGLVWRHALLLGLAKRTNNRLPPFFDYPIAMGRRYCTYIPHSFSILIHVSRMQEFDTQPTPDTSQRGQSTGTEELIDVIPGGSQSFATHSQLGF